MYKASVIVAFYKNLEVLKVVLTALEHQTEQNFEVIIADDGSDESTVRDLTSVMADSPLEIQHIWHEDLGFRKNRCLNLSVRASRSDYLIFIDGDCVPQRHFVEDHLEVSKPSRCINGRRADLSPRCSELLVSSANPATFVENNFGKMVWDAILGKGKNIEKGLRINSDFLMKKMQAKDKGLVGCNFSLYKEDLVSINGFDMRYEAAGVGEDSDVDYRLRLAGVDIFNCFFKATQVHIYHKELPRLEVNDVLFDKVRKSQQSRTPYGLDTLD
jgi:glycosyltransferase involved in cell wall biosynthesis